MPSFLKTHSLLAVLVLVLGGASACARASVRVPIASGGPQPRSSSSGDDAEQARLAERHAEEVAHIVDATMRADDLRAGDPTRTDSRGSESVHN